MCHKRAMQVGIPSKNVLFDRVEVRIGLYPIVTLEKQLLNMIRKLV
jgi:hypothetical protein